MYRETLEQLNTAAAQKASLLRANPLGYLISSMLAGLYVGIGVALVFALGAPLAAAHSPWVKVAMGTSFGIALSLVIVAGAELFTGNNLIMAVGCWRRTVTMRALLAVWCVSWLGNLLGALLLAALLQGAGVLDGDVERALLQRVAANKMTLPAGMLFLRAVLCNFLVCLAIWCAVRSRSEVAKLVMVFWCLYAFITIGFEHSVANMTLLGLALLQQPLPEFAAQLSWGGLGHNLLWVTLGNVLGGMLGVGGAYGVISRHAMPDVSRDHAPVPGAASR